MSVEAYKIAVRISLVESVTRGLQLMSRHFKTTDADAKALQARLEKIGKMAAVGGGLMGAGLGGLALLKGPLEEASKYQTLIERFKQFGMGDAALKDADKFVAAQDIMGASQRDMMRYFIEAQGVFRESGAKTVAEQLAAAKMAAPLMAKMNFAMTGLSEDARHATEAKQLDMLRFAEQAGGLQSPERFAALLNAGFKAVQSSGGNVDFSQYRQFMSKGRTAAFGLSDRSLFADFEPLIGELKGTAAGEAYRTSYNRLHGIVRLPNQAAHALVDNHLWDGSKIVWNNQGGIKTMKGDPLLNAAMFDSDPVDYYRQKVLPMYDKMKLSEAQRRRENAMIFGGSGGGLFNLIDKQLPTILRSREAYDKAHGITEEYKAIGQTYAGREAALTAKWQTLMLVIGKDGGVLDLATKGLGLLGDGLRKIINVARSHPTLTRMAFVGMAAFSALALVGGALTVVNAGLMGLGLILSPLALGLVPLSLAAAALGAAGWLVYNNWTEIRASLKVIFGDIWNAVVKLFHGDIGGALNSFWHAFLMSFQVTINTIVAALNAINPLFQIPKASFAGDPAGGYPKGVPQGGRQPIVIHHTTQIGKRVISRETIKMFTDAASRPPTGISGFNGNISPYRAGYAGGGQ